MRTQAAYTFTLTQVLLVTLLIGLFGSVTNLIFVSPLPSLLSVVLLPWYFYQRRDATLRVPRFVGYLYLYFAFSLVGVLIYHPVSLTTFRFYRYDGNFIISYAPLLLIPFFRYEFNAARLFKLFLVFATIVNGGAFLLNLFVTRFAAITDWSNPETYFHGLFRSTNAAGGFLSIMLSLNIVVLGYERRKKWLITLVLNSLFLIATTSRGSLLGLFAGFAFFYLDKFNRRWLILAGVAVICAVQAGILYFTYPIFNEYIRDANLSETSPNTYISPLFGPVGTKSANLIIRAVDTWPRGVDCFIHSPLIGAGFGSVNDTPLQYSGINYVVSLNSQPRKVFDDAHAHHSYFHILGEQGLLGLGIFLTFWLAVYRFLRRQPPGIVRNFLLVSYFNLTIMSFTEHRITSPSNALPFVIALCLYVLQVNALRKESLAVRAVS